MRTVKEKLAKSRDKNHLISAILLGAIASVVTALLWYGIVVVSKWQLGIIAIAVGFVIAKAMLVVTKHKTNRQLQIAAVLLTLFGMALAEYLIAKHFINQYLIGEGLEKLPLLIPVGAIFSILFESLKGDSLTLVFWGIAIWTAYSLTAPRHVISVPQNQPMQAKNQKTKKSRK